MQKYLDMYFSINKKNHLLLSSLNFVQSVTTLSSPGKVSWLLVAGVTSAAPADKLWNCATVELTEARTHHQQRRSQSPATQRCGDIYYLYLLSTQRQQIMAPLDIIYLHTAG